MLEYCDYVLRVFVFVIVIVIVFVFVFVIVIVFLLGIVIIIIITSLWDTSGPSMPEYWVTKFSESSPPVRTKDVKLTWIEQWNCLQRGHWFQHFTLRWMSSKSTISSSPWSNLGCCNLNHSSPSCPSVGNSSVLRGALPPPTWCHYHHHNQHYMSYESSSLLQSWTMNIVFNQPEANLLVWQHLCGVSCNMPQSASAFSVLTSTMAWWPTSPPLHWGNQLFTN